MSSVRKFDADRAAAELADLNGLLSRIDQKDFLTRASLQERKREVSAFLENLEAQPEQSHASIALFFGGKPVIANQGIESEFATDAVGKFQDLVAKYLANLEGGLAERGVVPNKDAAKLHITNIVRGSFGFLLEEPGSQRSLVNSTLKDAVSGVTELMTAMAIESDQDFEQELDEVDNRVLSAAQSFFDILSKSDATVRSVCGMEDFSFSGDAIARAVERANSTSIRESENKISGILVGALPHAHKFEIRDSTTNEVISGIIDRSLSEGQVQEAMQDYLNERVLATVTVKSVLRNGEPIRETYRLLTIAPDS
jgi:hypothetical protein